MMQKFLQVFLFLVLVIGLPLGGACLKGDDISLYLYFPPLTRPVVHEPFSWIAFVIISCILLVFTVPFVIKILRTPRIRTNQKAKATFPWWGYIALGFGVLFWIISWTRINVFSFLQRFTFTPLWIVYIIIVNALTFRRTASCLLTRRPMYLLVLFPVSATFWWLFEYLNRFVQNWYYVGVDNLSAVQYIIEATLAFSTVLPAVVSSVQFLKTYPNLTRGLENFRFITFKKASVAAWIVLALSCLGLFFIKNFPNILFPLLWVSPVLIMVSLSVLFGRPTILSHCRENNYQPVILYALAALVCGFFWEMWNMYSQAKWIYSVPYVHRFKIFEMPLLGFGGYLPFGLECAVISQLLINRKKESDDSDII